MSTVTVDLRRRCVSIKEGGQILGVSEMTFRRLVRSGAIQSFRIRKGKRSPHRIPLEAIEQYISRSLKIEK